jgi:tripartite-type tricarboxylate transporter receptor subunit TctC
VRIVVPTAPGSGSDAAARTVAQPLAARLGQQVLVDNRSGASNIIAAELVARSPADGHTLLLATMTLAITPGIFRKLPYDPFRDFAGVTQIASFPVVLVVHPSVPAQSVKQLIELARAHPRQISFASAGAGSTQHVLMEFFLLESGVRMMHVPYKSPAPAFIDLIAGRVDVMMAGLVGATPHLRAGRLRALAVTTAKRTALMPNLPTVAEAGVPRYAAVNWWGLLAPAGTPREIIERLNADITATLLVSDVQQRFLQEGAEIAPSSPEEFVAFFHAEIKKWAIVTKAAGVTAD